MPLLKLPTVLKKASVLTLLLASPLVFADPPRVLASIKPLQLIAQAITADVTEVDVLLPPGASPHSHSLKPSDARKLHSADVIFWVGPSMEAFLPKMLDSTKNATAVAMMDIPGIRLRKNGASTSEEHAHGEKHHDEDEHHHDHGEYDSHIWLSTFNGRAMATAITKVLASRDKANASQYKKNLKAFLQTMDKADARNTGKLAHTRQRPIVVFHDAYGYLQEQYQLNIAGHFTLNPEQQPGARHLSQLRERLKKAGNTCIFREPQFQPAYIDRLTKGLPVKVSELDPLGENIEARPDGFAHFINTLVDNISECVSETS
ncbi:MAG: zinc ABC transporter substrate-binding protein ZnuA [Endozoicomonas sp.]